MSVAKTWFKCLDIDNPMVAWEVAIGRIASANENEAGFGVSPWAYSHLREYANSQRVRRFADELELERVRLSYYPNQVSRLRGVFFFESKFEAEAALDRWGMATKKQYISAVTFYPSTLSKLDSEWITFNLGSSTQTNWMKSYWSGETSGIKPLTEILAMGTGEVQDKSLRIRAYQRIYKLWPTATP